MSSTRVTLYELFGLDRTPLEPDELPDLAKSGPLAGIRQRLGERAGVVWNAVRRRVPEQLRALLDVGAPDILVSAWNTSRELTKYRDPARYPPEQVVIVPLTKHKITSTHEPSVEVYVDGLSLGRVGFQLRVELTLQGAELKIQGGRILQIRTGRCDGVGTIACEGIVLKRIEGKVLVVPGTIDLGDGVPVPA